VHNPVYHSPFLYHITALVYWLFGDNDFTGRLSTSIAGILIAVMPLFFSRWLGKRGTLLAMVLLAISPVMMHRSRFIRHDQWAIFFNMLMLLGIVRYLADRKSRDLYLVAASLSLSFAGKETSYISVALMGASLAAVTLWEWLRTGRRRSLTDFAGYDLIILILALVIPLASPFGDKLIGHNPLDYSNTRSLAISGAMFGAFLAVGSLLGILWDRKRFIISALIFWGIYIPLYTTFFTNGQGLASGAVGSLGYWLSQHGEKRGGQPWYYYLIIIWMYEFLPVIGAAAAAIRYGRHGNPLESIDLESAPVRRARWWQASASPVSSTNALVWFLLVWGFGGLFMYSWAGEKMPWLAMQFMTPLCIVGGWGLSHMWDDIWATLTTRRAWLLFLTVPLTLYAVYHLAAFPPSRGTSTADLTQTMAWLAALLVALLAAWVSSKLLNALDRQRALQMLGVTAAFWLAVITLRFAWMVTFLIPDLPTAHIVYAQGTPDTRQAAKEIEDLSQRLYGDLSMKVAYDDDSYWPMVWYLRKFTNLEIIVDAPKGPSDAVVVLVGPSNEEATKPFLGDRYYRRQYRLIWWPDEAWYRDMTPAKLWSYVSTPDGRANLNSIWWNHDWKDLKLTQWSLYNPFAMYVRKDAAAQLWDFGVETALQPPDMADEYLDKWAARTAVASFNSLGLVAPRGLARDEAGNIYIADAGNHRIVVADANGQLVRTFGTQGSAPGQFNEPWDVAVAPNGDIYVADTWNYRIQVFAPDGSFKFSWGASGETSNPEIAGNSLYGPRSVAFDADGNVLVADTGNKRINKYSPEGKFLGGVGGEGSEPGQMREPVGIAVAGDGTIYVADTWNQRIQLLDASLKPLESWPVNAWLGTSITNKPYLAVADDGTLYVADPSGNRVIAFGEGGELLGVWGQFGSGLDGLSNPTGLLVDADGRLLVADSGNNRILVFEALVP